MNSSNLQPNKKELRQFSQIMAIMLVVLFGLILPWLFGKAWPLWPWILAALFFVLGLIIPITLRPIYWLWMKFGLIMGWINTRLILGIVYFLFITPLGWLLKLFGKDLIGVKLSAESSTYRVQREEPIEPEHMERPF